MSQPTQAVTVIVERGYHPSSTVVAGRPVRLTFLRREAGSCSQEVVIPAFGIRKALPQNVPVTVNLPPLAAGALAITCGMNMLRGTLQVDAA
jgi:plastocyanin domain-containing protein